MPGDEAIDVRELRSDEVDVWRRLRLDALRDSPDAFGRTYQEESKLGADTWTARVASSASDPNITSLVAMLGGQPVGIAVARVDPERPRLADVFSMWVSPKARRRGLGRRLLHHAAQWASERGADEMQLHVTEDNHAAFGLYAAAGFVDTGDRVPLREGSSVQTIRMRRRIRTADR